MLKTLDAYSLKARYYPALLATLPSLVALAVLISWSKFGITTAVASVAIPTIVFVAADIARRFGKRIQDGIYCEIGGLPSTTMLRYSDTTLDEQAKAEYRAFLAKRINRPLPTAEQEKADPKAADSFYERAGTWLRENTRDTKKYSVLFGENITYGFRRNILGLKWPALGLNAILTLLCGYQLYSQGPVNFDDDATARVLLVLVLAVVHSFILTFAVSRNAVIEAARTYARQLIYSCETFLGKQKSAEPAKAKKSKK